MGRRLRALLAGIGLSVLAGGAVSVAPAAEGDLDRSFSGDGRLVLTAPTASATAVGVDSRGRIVVAGSTDPAGSDPRDITVARLMPGGALDRTWSGDGIVSFDASQGGEQDITQALAIDSRNRVLVAGYSGPLAEATVLARLTPAGALDAGFAQGDGIRRDNPNPIAGDDFTDLIVASGDRPVAVGTTGGGGNANWLVARYTAAGAPDGAFSTDGFDTLNLGAAASTDLAEGVAIDSQGRVVVGGRTRPPAADNVGFDFAAARWTPGGQLDSSFSGGDATPGRAIVDMTAGEWDEGREIAIVAGDKPLVVGDAHPAGQPEQAAVLRLTAAGLPDGSYSGDGKSFLNVPEVNNLLIHAGSVDRLGRVVAAATQLLNGKNSFWLGRFLPNGGVDRSFSGDGMVTTDFDPPDAFLRDMATDPRSGLIVAAGSVTPPSETDWAISRYEGVPRCRGRVPTVAGTNGRDLLRGSKRKDVIAGYGGGDVLRGLGRADLLCGGRGRDRLLGGRGGDRLLGDRGGDRLLGGAGRDRLVGGPGRDVLFGGPGRDRLRGGPGRDRQRQ